MGRTQLLTAICYINAPSNMKFCNILVLAAFASSASAFSAIAPTSNGAATSNPEPVDRSMKGIDGDSATAFDPTSGTSPALIRNNIDQVWVPQVCTNFDCRGCMYVAFLTCLPILR